MVSDQVTICHHCYAIATAGKALLTCSSCKKGKECQKKHWKAHKLFCRGGSLSHELVSAFAKQTGINLVPKDTSMPVQDTGPLGAWGIVITCLPPTPGKDIPSGLTDCTLPSGLKERILALPGFLRPVPSPSLPTHRIACIPGAGLGMFTARCLVAGEVIFAECPIIITLQAMFPLSFKADRQSVGSAEYKRKGTSVSQPGEHCPNSMVTFDLKSFSFVICVLYNVDTGIPITISYLHNIGIMSAAERQHDLTPYAFKCTCISCALPAISDLCCREITNTLVKLLKLVCCWMDNTHLPDDYLMQPSLCVLRLVTEEGLEFTDTYMQHLMQLVAAYVALGDRKNYLWAQERIMQSMEANLNSALAADRSKFPEDLEMHGLWRRHVKVKAS
ncbi:hypothetical protein EWM64_g5893 [Hericium alpestre]|uniref:MYND-type domain-containing protein n=1 Tax=Hericium alpestre TaxID=135208 RepID=A0A4Y9ZVC7_9AGAM|nr:hypothetical protein EWM64_g5893 [Hericium alpestre]